MCSYHCSVWRLQYIRRRKITEWLLWKLGNFRFNALLRERDSELQNPSKAGSQNDDAHGDIGDYKGLDLHQPATNQSPNESEEVKLILSANDSAGNLDDDDGDGEIALDCMVLPDIDD